MARAPGRAGLIPSSSQRGVRLGEMGVGRRPSHGYGWARQPEAVAKPPAQGPWRVFLSHTSELRQYPSGGSYIDKAERAISAAGHVVVDMRDFPSIDQAPAQVCIDRVNGCDVYVGIYGTRWGSPVRDRPEVSYTELEFDTATATRGSGAADPATGVSA